MTLYVYAFDGKWWRTDALGQLRQINVRNSARREEAVEVATKEDACERRVCPRCGNEFDRSINEHLRSFRTVETTSGKGSD